jgi:hypothetical protein
LNKFWEIQEGKVDSSVFFKLLIRYFPDATTLYIEGTAIADDVKKCYVKHFEVGDYLPGSQTKWPKSNDFRCAFSTDLMEEMALLAEHHAEPELLDHLSLYKGSDSLLEWHDAFANILLLPCSIPEETVSKFSKELGLEFKKV